MKKQITVILLSALILSGCASGRMGNPGAIMAGASIGGSLGGSIGGLIGDNNHGWRGGYRGSAIGNIVGTIAGAAMLIFLKYGKFVSGNIRNSHRCSDLLPS